LLFAAKLNIQNSGIKDVLLDNAQEKLKLAIEHIRKIALESTTQFVFNDNFLTTITDYVLGFNSESTTKFRIDTEIQEPLIVNNLCKKHIFRIIQRLVHFSINTSKSKNCSIRFKQIKNDFVIIAVDNGFFNFDFPTRSHDLKSIQDRIYLIEGQIRFFNFSNQGLAVHIKIKLHE
jgi:signal transduction histidine kinase